MKIENKCCSRMTKLSEVEYGSVVRHEGKLYLITDDGGNEGYCFNDNEDNNIIVASLEDGRLIMLAVDGKYEVVKAKVVVE